MLHGRHAYKEVRRSVPEIERYDQMRDEYNDVSRSVPEGITISWRDEKGMHKSVINGENLSNYVMLPIGKMKVSETSEEQQKVIRPKSAKLPRTEPVPVEVERTRPAPGGNNEQAPLRICDQGENWTMFYKPNANEEIKREQYYQKSEKRAASSNRPKTSRFRPASSSSQTEMKGEKNYRETDNDDLRSSGRPKTARSRPATRSDDTYHDRGMEMSRRPKTARSRPPERNDDTYKYTDMEISRRPKTARSRPASQEGFSSMELYATNTMARRISDEMERLSQGELEMYQQQVRQVEENNYYEGNLDTVGTEERESMWNQKEGKYVRNTLASRISDEMERLSQGELEMYQQHVREAEENNSYEEYGETIGTEGREIMWNQKDGKYMRNTLASRISDEMARLSQSELEMYKQHVREAEENNSYEEYRSTTTEENESTWNQKEGKDMRNTLASESGSRISARMF